MCLSSLPRPWVDLALFLSSMISYSDGVELGPPPFRRRMPKILIPAQLLKETADYQGLLLGTMLLWIMWKWEPVSVDAKSFHGPPAILNHHSCSVNKRVIFRNGSPVSFPVLLHSSLDPLAFFYGPLLQKKPKDLSQPVSHNFIEWRGKLKGPSRIIWTQRKGLYF